ncbi:trna 2-thiouridylase [Lasius niger]|uniref:Trna 2-thiouridylase n=1 Tax=Lasius niger TaxID=67767 RepID=A0A0J7K4J5_LASNI|nr:trna 2-thiouridylase [Lasius niger]
MSDTSKASTKPKTGWIYNLTKPEIIQHLRDRGVLCTENKSIDDLRKQLAKLVKGQGAKGKSENEAAEKSEATNQEINFLAKGKTPSIRSRLKRNRTLQEEGKKGNRAMYRRRATAMGEKTTSTGTVDIETKFVTCVTSEVI